MNGRRIKMITTNTDKGQSILDLSLGFSHLNTNWSEIVSRPQDKLCKKVCSYLGTEEKGMLWDWLTFSKAVRNTRK